MRDYGQIRMGFWTSPDIRELDDGGKLLAAYLVAGPHTTALGCFRCPDGYVSEDLGWGSETVSKRFRKLESQRFATRDQRSGVVFVRRFLHHNPPRNPNQWKNITKLFDQIPKNVEFIGDLVSALLEMEGVPKPFANRLRAVAKQVGNGLPIKEQEQEQEQDISPVTRPRDGEEPTDLLAVDDALQQVLDAGLKLTRPGTSHHRRLARLCPVRRGDLAAAIAATHSAVSPNWKYLLDCLETPMQTGPPGKSGRHRGSEFTDADDYSGVGPPPMEP